MAINEAASNFGPLHNARVQVRAREETRLTFEKCMLLVLRSQNLA